MCGCRETVNEKLKAKNAQLAYGFTMAVQDRHAKRGGMSLSPPMIQLEKLDKKKRGTLPIMLASYCPFCGDRLPD